MSASRRVRFLPSPSNALIELRAYVLVDVTTGAKLAHALRRSFLPTKESESIGERNEILFAWPPGSFVSSGGITRIRTAGRTAGFAARTFTCLDHRNGTIAFAKQPVVTRDQIKDTIHPSFSLCSFLLTSFRRWAIFFLPRTWFVGTVLSKRA